MNYYYANERSCRHERPFVIQREKRLAPKLVGTLLNNICSFFFGIERSMLNNNQVLGFRFDNGKKKIQKVLVSWGETSGGNLIMSDLL